MTRETRTAAAAQLGRLPDPAALFRLAVRLMPAFALFALVLADDPLLQWLSLLGFLPLGLALVPGAPACGACRAGSPGRSVLPPAH
ncbi:MAG: hypothetical protein GVY13_13045 [Alphaproteobacteria bacterium]|jgi:hypothetical protein|nr:hypothetical protein [Alphaproteobacteria bacterium]